MFFGRRVILALLILTLMLHASTAAAKMNVLPQRVPAPSLDGGGDWINVSGPIDLQDLRGKFVLLDFWTYCCINCMHILPELKKLEHEFPHELVVIGVHSAKFATERDTENIREAVLRHEIEHPVVNDANLALWRKFGVSVWPTLIVIDPEGFVIAHHQGEISYEDLRSFFRPVVNRYRSRRLLDDTPVRFDLEIYQPHEQPLRFPGKVLADADNDRLFIADSGHHRIVVTTLDGRLQRVIGTGALGNEDGDFAQASFARPQGMALHDGHLYVADTENHLIRKVDFGSRQVSTVAGNGEQAREAPRRASVSPLYMPLASPWDLLIHRDDMYIAMAGLHQIWKMELDRGTIGPYAGNAIEDIIDGPLLPPVPYRMGFASFAQPSGLASDGQRMFVADSEGSSIRVVPFSRNGRVETVVGTSTLPDARLFTYGDRDGPADQALLQHPIGVAYDEGRIYVADTYNHKIKVISVASGATATVTTLAGGDGNFAADSESEFNEPSGLSVSRGKLFVADTNHHRIAVIDSNRRAVTTLNIPDLQPPSVTGANILGTLPDATTRTFQPATIRPRDNTISLVIDLELAADHKINADAPTSYVLQVAGDNELFDPRFVDAVQQVEQPAESFEIVLPLKSPAGTGRVKLSLVFYYCREGADAVCKIGNVAWTGEISVVPEAEAEFLALRHQVQ